MKFERNQFSEIERPLAAITRHTAPTFTIKESLRADYWEDPLEGRIGVLWYAPGLLTIAKSIAEFHYPFTGRPKTEYSIHVTNDDSGLSTNYRLNSMNRHGTIFKTVSDANKEFFDLENFHKSQALANKVGINAVTIEDFEVIKGIVQRRAAEI